MLGAIASSAIGVAGTTFSITVAALTLASNQMGPRLLRNFTRDTGNQYALGALVATFAFALTALRSVREADEGAFVPQLAVTAALLLAFACAGVLVWFLHHVATSINVMRVAALVHADLAKAIGALPRRRSEVDGAGLRGGRGRRPEEGAPLAARGAGYLRVLDEEGLADWAAERGAVFRLRVRPGDFVFPDAPVGEVWPVAVRAGAEEALREAMVLGDERSVEQDLEHGVRQNSSRSRSGRCRPASTTPSPPSPCSTGSAPRSARSPDANCRKAVSAAPARRGSPGPPPTTPGCWTRCSTCCARPARASPRS